MVERSASAILHPRLVALDSSHIGALARDSCCADAKRNRDAKAFVLAFNNMGCVLLLSLHHIQELITHRDEAVVQERMTFLASLPMLAWIASAAADEVVGSVLDILAHEVATAYAAPDADAVAVRDAVAAKVIRLDSGLRAVAPFLEQWRVLRPMLLSQQERARKIVAISRSNFAGVSNIRVRDYIDAKLRNPADIARRFHGLHGSLAADIRSRGDKRIVDAAQTATEFLEDVTAQASEALAHTSYPTLQFLKAFDVDLAEIDENTTVGDVGELATFRKKLGLVNRNLGLPWSELRSCVKASKLPSEVIQSALRRYGQDNPERKGSDLADSYLACLSAYAVVTYVDKRTCENVRRARQKSAVFAAVARRVEKAGSYQDIKLQLAAG